jgi:hypothetical protein
MIQTEQRQAFFAFIKRPCRGFFKSRRLLSPSPPGHAALKNNHSRAFDSGVDKARAMASGAFKPALIVVDFQEDFCPPVHLI